MFHVKLQEIVTKDKEKKKEKKRKETGRKYFANF